MKRGQLAILVVLVLVLAGLYIARSRGPASTSGWRYTFNAGTAEELEAGRAAARALSAKIGETRLRQVGGASATHSGGTPPEIRETTTRFSGDGFDLRGVTIEIVERDVVADGPEVVVMISAEANSDEDRQRFRTLQQQVLDLCWPSRPR